MNGETYTAAPAKLIDALKQTQETMQRLQASMDAAIFGAACALDVPAHWQWNGAGWTAPAEQPDEPNAPDPAPY